MVHKMEGFDIDKETYEDIEKKISLMSSTTELECKFKEPINKDAFLRMIKYCRSTNMTEKLQEDQLDIFCKLPTSPSVIRISVIGKDNISQYCKNNTVKEDTLAIVKKPIKGARSLSIKDLNFKVDLKEESPFDEFAKHELFARLPSLEKGYRYKKRYSYEDRNVRYDFTIVKSSKDNANEFICHPGLVTSGLLGSAETYEAEIEYAFATDSVPKKRGRVATSRNTSEASKDLFQAMVTLFLVYKQESRYIPLSMKQEALTNYLRLCFGSNVDKDLLEKNPRTYFAAPQPVTLERKNVAKPDLGVVSILEDYTVTEKADGERCLLFVNSDGRCYLIDSRLNMRFTGTKLNNLVNTLLDGEFITSDILGNRTSVYGVFDIYYHNAEDVRSLPLIGGRYDKLKEIEKRFTSRFEEDSGSIRLFVKKFLHGASIFENAKKVLDQSSSLPYKIDGLIFTPAKLGVPNTYGTWDKVFKYKPPEENTIDFLVKFGLMRADIGTVMQELELYVGYNPQQHTRITTMDFINGNTRQRKGYIAKRFEPADVLDGSASSCFLELGEDRTIRCENGDEITNNTIVEFAWINGKWTPNRLRKDKTELYAKQGLSRTANDITSAMSVWRTIQNPVTYEMITGKVPVPEDVVNDEDTYYFRNISRDKMATKSMLDFHNIWIKNRCLINKYKGKTLLDIACGKAGDLNKWMEAGIEKVVGIDYSRDNIENPNDGAIVRTIKKLATTRNTKSKFLFLTMDGGEELSDDYFNKLSNANDKTVAKVAWGYEKPPVSSPRLQEYYKFIPAEGFDLVSCQFAIHYFFENKIKLRNFVRNVAKHLKPGGYFVGTCLDSQKIRESFAKSESDELRGEKDGRVIWNIKKLTDDAVEIYMESIGRRMKEHLVDFDLLVDEFAKHDIKLAMPITSFKEEHDKMMIDDAARVRLGGMTDIEKQYSFLNSYFVFQRGKGT